GHAYGPDSLLFHKDGKLEDALWTAVRLMEENAAFRIRLSQRAREARLESMAGEYAVLAAVLTKRAEVLRDLLHRNSLKDLGASGAVDGGRARRRETDGKSSRTR